MEKIELTFEREKETPNTTRFKERVPDGDRPKVGTLYIQKPNATKVATVKVTIEETR